MVLGEQPCVLHALDQISGALDILRWCLADRQIALVAEVEQPRRDLLAPVQHVLVRPGMTPMEPPLRISLAAEEGQAHEVVETSAVHAANDHLGTFDQGFQRQILVAALLPIPPAGPAIVAEVATDLDVEMLRQEDVACLGAFG